MRVDIEKRLQSDYKQVEELGYEVLCVMVQGSQNYNLEYEGSDVDTKAIVLPKFNSIIFSKQPASTTLVLPSNEHIDIKDIRIMFECYRRQNINFLETLFSKYELCNPKYVEYWEKLKSNRELIAHYNTHSAVKCIVGMMLEKYKALEHPYPSLIDKIEKYGYDPKQLHHIVRCLEFLKNYINDVPFENCLIPADREYLISIKRIPPRYSLKEARELAKNCIDEAKEIERNYLANNELYINTDAALILDNILDSVLRKSIFDELKGNSN